MADYQGFASNVLAGMRPRQDDTRQNALALYQMRGQQEDRAFQREENALNRGYRERQLGLQESASQRADQTLGLAADEKKRDLTGRILTNLFAIPDPGQRAAQYPGVFATAKRAGLDLSELTGDYAQDEPTLQNYHTAMKEPPKEQGEPDAVRQYKFAQGQGFKGSLLDFKTALAAAGASKTDIRVGESKYGTIPPGYQLEKLPDGTVRMAKIPGGPAAEGATDAAAKEALRKADQGRQADVVLQNIDRAFDLMESARLPVAGAGGSAAAMVPGTAANDVRALMDTVRAAVGFDKLQSMRAASPTGGALGNVSDNENKLLQSVLGSLDQSQSKEQFEFNLSRLYNTYLDTIHGPGEGPKRRPLTGVKAKAPAPASAPAPGGGSIPAPPPGFIVVQ